VAALAMGMAGFLRRSIGPLIGVDMGFPDGLPLVRTDPSQLETALLNLVVNARDAMPQGGRVTISAERETVGPGRRGLGPGDYVRLTVTDNGEGMDEATLAKATEPFFTTKGVGKGTGLGLSMAQGLAAQSGGDLAVASRKGVGTTVALRLPIAEQGVQTPEAAVPFLEKEVQVRPVRVLVVDDDRLVLANTAALLEDLGHHVTTAGGGREALERVRQDPAAFDLVITDQAMPQMTGLQLCEALARVKRAPPVLIMTGFADLPPASARAFQRLAKPFTQSDLSAAIVSLLAHPRRRRAPDKGASSTMH
jgi:CheY-like chemotaxis protein